MQKIKHNLTRNLKNHVMEASRRRKFVHFRSLCNGPQSVLDVGVQRERLDTLPAVNYFLKNFELPERCYTGLGVDDLSALKAKYPRKRFVQYAGRTFPFRDKAFDWVFSNAVIEHVGDEPAQQRFLDEMLRVARRVFFTTPSKGFPIETHTSVLFLHWSDVLFYRWCARHTAGVKKRNLYLFSYRRLRQLLERSRASTYRIHNNRLLGMTMTFTVMCRE